MTTKTALPDQPDGIDEYTNELPDPVRAAKRVREYICANGDGMYHEIDGHPLYARDLEAVCRTVLNGTAELDKVRAQLTDTHNRAHADATNLQQILRDKTALANERDALVTAADDLLQHIDLIRERWAVLLPHDVGETLLARGAALAALLPNTQEPCNICSGYGCPDCHDDLSGVAR